MTTARKKRLKTIFRRALALLFTLAALGQNALFPALPTARAADTSINIFRWHKITSKSALTRDQTYWQYVMVIGQGACGHWMLNPTGNSVKNEFILNDSKSNVVHYPWYDEYSSGIEFFSLGAMNNMAYKYLTSDEGGSTDCWYFRLLDSQDRVDAGLKSDEKEFGLSYNLTYTPYRIDERDGGFRIYHFDKGGYDEDWYFKNGKWWLDERDRDTFYIWGGLQYTARQIDTHASEIINGQTTVYGQPLAYIPSGMTLTVKSGGVLVVTGALLNDGQLTIEDGGMLILKNNSVIMPFTRTDLNAGGFTSKGTVILQTNAKLVGGGVNGIQINGGSVTNFGLMISECFQVKKPYLVENKSTGKVIAGYSVGLNYRNKMLKDAFNNSGKDTVTTTTPVSEITASNYSSYTRTDLSDNERTVRIPDNGVYGGSLWSQGNIKSYQTKIYRVQPFSRKLELMWYGMSADIKASKGGDKLTFTVTEEGNVKTYDVPFQSFYEGILSFNEICITIDKGSGEEKLYNGMPQTFNPDTLNNLK